MKISDLIDESHVLLDFPASEKPVVLRHLADIAAAEIGADANAIVAALFHREALGSTGVGAGVALPHARLVGLSRPFGIFAKLRKPVHWDAVDGGAVDLVCLLLLPTEDPTGDAMSALATVARRLRQPDALADIRKSGRASDASRALNGNDGQQAR